MNTHISPSLEIRPPIAVSVTNNINTNTFDVASTGWTTTYSVEIGAEFELQCQSVATEDNSLVGKVTWYMTSSSGLYL